MRVEIQVNFQSNQTIKANGIEVSVYCPPPAWAWNYRINFSLYIFKIIFIIGRFSTSGLSNIYTIYIIFTAFTHFLIVKPSIRGWLHQRWSDTTCSTSFINSQNDDSGVRIAAWFLNQGSTLFCLLFGHWTSINVSLAGTQIDFIIFSDQIMNMIQIMNNEQKPHHILNILGR